jgi:hypothetical protein
MQNGSEFPELVAQNFQNPQQKQVLEFRRCHVGVMRIVMNDGK